METQAVKMIAAKVAAVGHAVATGAQSAATAVATGAQWALNAALNANPIGLVVLAIAALAAGLVIAYQKSETFRDIVDGAMGKVQDAVGFVVDAVEDVVKWVKDAAGGWDAIQSAAEAAMGPVEAAVGGVRDALAAAVGWVKDLITWIGKIDFPEMPGWLPGARMLAEGGGGGFEAGPGGAWGDKWGNSATPASPPVVYNFTIQGAIDPVSTARQIRQIMRDGAALNGSPDWGTL
jgi:uncharacterized protein YjbJ (UPF0337 family)